MKKVVVDVRMINSSGIGVYLKNILPSILKLDYNFTLLGDTDELEKIKWTKNIKVINFTEKIYSLKEQLLYPKIIPECDVLWMPHFNIPVLKVKAKIIISTIHDVNHLAKQFDLNRFKYLYAKLLYENAVKKSNKIITVSNFSKQELLKYTSINSSKIDVIYNGVTEFFFSKISDQQILDVNNIIEDNYILFVGNVKPHKNLITLLKAYALKSDEFKKNYKLVILGKKSGFITSDDKIFEFIEKEKISNSVLFTGYLSDEKVISLYKKASMFVFPSLYEGFGLPIIEAMASETPVICAKSSSLTEVGGDCVLYFDPLNYNELAVAIEDLIDDEKLKQNLITKGVKRAQMFSWKKSIDSHLNIFKNILNS